MRALWVLFTTTGLGAWALPNGPGDNRLYQPPALLRNHLEGRRTELCLTCMSDCNEPETVPDHTILNQLKLPDGYDKDADCLPACNKYTADSLTKEVHMELRARGGLQQGRYTRAASGVWSSLNQVTAPAVLRTIGDLRCTRRDYHPRMQEKPTPLTPDEERKRKWREIREFEERVRRENQPPSPVIQPKQPGQRVQRGQIPGMQLPNVPSPPKRPPPQLPNLSQRRRVSPSAQQGGPQLPGFLSQTADQLQQVRSNLHPTQWNMDSAKQSIGEAWTSFQRSGAAAAALQRVKSIPQRVPAFAP